MAEDITTTDNSADPTVAGDAAEDKSVLTGDPTQNKASSSDDKGVNTNDADKDSDADDDQQQNAPEAYDDFEVPEGMHVNEELMGQFTEIAKELNLSQDQAQKLVTLEAEKVQLEVQMQADAWAAKQQEWVDQGKSDREFGGDGYNQNIQTALVAMDKIGTPELKEALDASGMGNHPELIRAFFRVGKLLAEDSPVGGSGGSTPKSRAETLYPSN